MTDKKWGDQVEEELEKDLSKLKAKPEVEPKDEDAPLEALTSRATKSYGLHEKGMRVIVEQSDPNSPLFSVKTFEELKLSPELLQGVYAMGFTKPSKIQETALPNLIGPTAKHMIGQSQAGTGKTAAFTLAMLSHCDPEVQAPQAICTCPTRELARQIRDVVAVMAKFTKLSIQLVVKDMDFPKTITSQVVIGTPGKILDLIRTNTLSTKKIKIFVLDEADQMIDRQGLGEQSIKLKKLLPPKCLIVLFSATFKDQVREFAERIVPKPCFNIRLKRKELTVEGIKQLYIDCKTEANKFNILSDLYAYLNVGQSIIFVHTRKTAKELTEKMKQAGHTVSLLHGGEDMSAAERDKTIDDFRDAKTKVLITTNVLSRGIDIPTVMMVINYDLPLDADNRPDPQTYLHRIGRSGRFGRKGMTINFVHDQLTKNQLKAIETYLGRPIQEFPADKLEDIQPMLEALQEEQSKEDDDEDEKKEKK